MVTYTFSPSAWEAEVGEFEANLVYMISGTVMTIPCMEKRKKKKRKRKEKKNTPLCIPVFVTHGPTRKKYTGDVRHRFHDSVPVFRMVAASL